MAAALTMGMDSVDRRTPNDHSSPSRSQPHGVPFPARRQLDKTGQGSGRYPWLRSVLQGFFAAVFLCAGTIWTIHQHKPKYLKPGTLLNLPEPSLPAQVVKAVPQDVEVVKVTAALRKYTKDTVLAKRIATALVKEGGKENIDPAMLVGLLITEDAKLDPRARSNVGARGLLQVMPFHAGKWGCSSSDLFNIEANVCHGVAILASYMKKQPDLHKALLKYNGCVRGTNTPNCHTYSGKVLKYAEEAAQAMLGAGIGDLLD